jgi:hypothetical protein
MDRQNLNSYEFSYADRSCIAGAAILRIEKRRQMAIHLQEPCRRQFNPSWRDP